MSNTSGHPNDPTTALWKECIAGWENLVLAFGHPVELVRWGWMRALEYRALGHWLRRLEALVRHAILADALTREIPAPKPRAAGDRASKRHAQPTCAEDMPRFRPTCRIDPTTWKVSFRMLKPHVDLDGEASNPRRRPRAKSEPLARRRTRPFAHRIEALRRAIRYREDYVARFARRLTRLATASQHGPDDQLASGPVRALIAYLPHTLATAIELILWNAKYAEPG